MENAISEYQRWKQQGETLRVQARQAMETRFRDLLTEAARISQEYHADFGAVLKPPPQVTAFRFKTGAAKGKKVAAKGTAPAARAVSPAAPKAVSARSAAEQKAAGQKVTGLEKRLAQARAKLESAKAAGKPTRNLEDRIYEIDDELRLANQQG